ncbi:arginase family protein [Mucilaginibacter aquariorum]|uniref:Arginase family protein n=1 Tax=Mucilaginibacter aquariorum TaxID=2967225 RepID=A0ABT1T9P8_9SPHI|nr:arginase family protein [Mucilaginibacter aquariorum]MCQ6961349.1 arginase family protein [Mucilaginibacter aquariorum]
MKNLIIIEAPSNLGLKQLRNVEPGVRKLPAWLKARGLHDVLQPQKVIHVEPPPYSMHLDKESGVRNADAIVSYSKTLSEEIKTVLNAGQFPLVIGGDCSILIGCALGLRSVGNFGLFFIDGHTDFVLPHFSETKAAAGMDLALISGNGPDKLANINSLKPYIAEKNIFAIGNRYLQNDYVKLITDSAISYYDLHNLRAAGMKHIVKKFLKKVESHNLDGFWIHLDVDVLNNEVMPCVDSPQPGGLSYEELRSIIRALLSSSKIKGINITILDPDLDPDGNYSKAFIENFSQMFPA